MQIFLHEMPVYLVGIKGGGGGGNFQLKFYTAGAVHKLFPVQATDIWLIRSSQTYL